MIGYCIPCAKTVGVQPALGMADHAVAGVCAICIKSANVLTETFYGEGRHRLNGAALEAKLKRGRALERTTP